MTQEQFDQLILSLQKIIRETADFMRTEFENFSYSDVEYKGGDHTNTVSYVDIESEKKLKSACAELLPGCGFINEESENQPTQNGYTWIIDPLDGTNNFTHGIPHFSISLALEYEGERLLGFVVDVMRDEWFFAQKGKGASLNGRPIRVSKQDTLGYSLIATGFPYDRVPKLDVYTSRFYRFLAKVQGVRRFGSAALDLAYVACGRYDGYYEATLNPWDIAAGLLLVEEAGGIVTDFEGGKDLYNEGGELIASNGQIHEEMVEAI